MLKLRINPIVAKNMKSMRDFYADNENYAAKTIAKIKCLFIRWAKNM